MTLKLLKYKIPIIYASIILVASCLATYFITVQQLNTQQNLSDENSSTSNYTQCNYTIKRNAGFKFIQPIMFIDNECESAQFSSLKKNLEEFINKKKSDGQLKSASVYIKEFEENNWMCINENEKFNPGSLLKVPLLMTYLKMYESNSTLMEKNIEFAHSFNTGKDPLILSKGIALGKKYSVKELIEYMIKYSDNNATILLTENMDKKVFEQTFTSFGFTLPTKESPDFPMTTKEYSIFLRALFNSCYLNNKNSEYAINLLTSSDFNDGLIKGIPSSILVAHKFGEAGNASEKQLHESGIIYFKNKPYILTIMTSGYNLEDLKSIISNISKSVYQSITVA